jgi:DNA invertase Pin-like site-specific DNA recombinase
VSTRREREQRQQRYEQAKANVRREAAEAKAARPSDYGIRSLADLLEAQPVPEVILYSRVSTRNQNVSHHLVGSRRRLRDMGVKVVAAFGGVESGKQTDPVNRPELVKAFTAAREPGILLIPVPSRLARHPDYDAHENPGLMPTADTWEQILKLADGVTIVTLSDPDSDPPGDEAFLRQLAADVKHTRVGRPRKKVAGYAKARRRRWIKQVRKWHEEGWSCREIATEITAVDGLYVSHKTVWQWLSTRGKTVSS